MEYLNIVDNNITLKDYLKQLPEEKKVTFENEICLVYNSKKIENGSKIFYGKIANNCSLNMIPLNTTVCFWKEDLTGLFEFGGLKLGYIKHEKIYTKVKNLKFENIIWTKTMLSIINDVIEIDVDYICKRFLIHNPPSNYYNKYTLILDKVINTPYSNKTYIFNIIKEIYIELMLKKEGVYDIQHVKKDNVHQAKREWDNLPKQVKSVLLFNKRLVELGLTGDYWTNYLKSIGRYSGQITAKTRGLKEFSI